VANALIGVVMLGKRYSVAQLLSVAVVSAGLVATALAGAAGGAAGEESETPLGLEGMVAVACLSGALLARALSGGLQEAAFAKCETGRASAS